MSALRKEKEWTESPEDLLRTTPRAVLELRKINCLLGNPSELASKWSNLGAEAKRLFCNSVAQYQQHLEAQKKECLNHLNNLRFEFSTHQR